MSVGDHMHSFRQWVREQEQRILHSSSLQSHLSSIPDGLVTLGADDSDASEVAAS